MIRKTPVNKAAYRLAGAGCSDKDYVQMRIYLYRMLGRMAIEEIDLPFVTVEQVRAFIRREDQPWLDPE